MEKQRRLIALDAFRGITIAGMIMVNQPGNRKYMFGQMRHSAWDGCTVTDLIFPFFLIIVGVAMWFAFQKLEILPTGDFMKKIVRRSVIIFAIGVFLNIAGQFFGTFHVDFSELRITGVLQRIAFCYFFASLLCYFLNYKQVFIASIGILIGYWFVLWFFGGDAPYAAETTIVGKIDRALLTKNHLRQGYAVDASGLFGSVPAIVNVLWGYLIGRMVAKSKGQTALILNMFLLGVPAILLAEIWNYSFPINKALWTSSYVLYTTGWALVTLAFFIWIIDVKEKKSWITPLLVFGVNPLFAYVFAQLWSSIMSSKLLFSGIFGVNTSAKSWISNDLFSPLIGNLHASLLYSIVVMVFYWSILQILYKKKIYIKI